MNEFKPDWCIAPADTLREWIDATVGGHVSVLAVACGGKAHKATSEAHIQSVLNREPMSEFTAMVLSKGTGISARFWLALEHNYRAGLAAGLTDVFKR